MYMPLVRVARGDIEISRSHNSQKKGRGLGLKATQGIDRAMADTTTSSGILSRQELEDVLEGLENQAGALEDEIHLIGEVFLRKVTLRHKLLIC